MNIFVSAFGYIVNSSVLSKLFYFSNYNGKKFNAIGDISFSDVHRAVFEIFGYHSDALVFSPAGVNNVMLYIAFIFFIVCFIVCIKKYESERKRFFFIIAAVMIVLNSFAIIHIEYGERYFIPSLVYCVPCFALFLESQTLSALKKYLVGLSFSVVLISGAFITYIDILTSDGNLDKRAVCRFLDDNYDFGYATFWNANVFAFMTDGRLEFGNLYPDTIDGVDYIPEKFQCHLWLTPKRFYRDDYKSDEPIFFLVTQKEYADSTKRTIFKNGRQVYSDDFYRVFEFENKKAFIDGF